MTLFGIDFTNYVELAAMILFGIGLVLLLVDKNLIKKNIAFAMTDSAIYPSLAALGYIYGRRAPILHSGINSADAPVTPLLA